MPKCPLCFAAYGGALSVLGLGAGAQHLLAELLIAVAVIGSFGLVLSLAIRRRDAATPLVSAAGAALVLAGRFAFDTSAVAAVGAVLLVAAAIANSVLCQARSDRSASARRFDEGPADSYRLVLVERRGSAWRPNREYTCSRAK